ncbi:MAG: hypothetical protein AAF639_35340 [Chloroflexota bacterium]
MQGPQTGLLTTQLFFPEDIHQFQGSKDFDEALVIHQIEESGSRRVATFNFALAQSA